MTDYSQNKYSNTFLYLSHPEKKEHEPTGINPNALEYLTFHEFGIYCYLGLSQRQPTEDFIDHSSLGNYHYSIHMLDRLIDSGWVGLAKREVES